MVTESTVMAQCIGMVQCYLGHSTWVWCNDKETRSNNCARGERRAYLWLYEARSYIEKSERVQWKDLRKWLAASRNKLMKWWPQTSRNKRHKLQYMQIMKWTRKSQKYKKQIKLHILEIVSLQGRACPDMWRFKPIIKLWRHWRRLTGACAFSPLGYAIASVTQQKQCQQLSSHHRVCRMRLVIV